MEGNGDPVRPTVCPLLGAIVHTRSQHQTDGDAELVTRDDGTTDLAGCNLRHVENDDSRDKSNTETGNETTGNKKSDAGRSGLQNDADDENGAARDDSNPTTEPISQITGDEGTEESSSGENGNDERLSRGRNRGGILGAVSEILETVGGRLTLTSPKNSWRKYSMPRTPLM